jgi:hypothetical protein
MHAHVSVIIDAQTMRIIRRNRKWENHEHAYALSEIPSARLKLIGVILNQLRFRQYVQFNDGELIACWTEWRS